MNEAKNQLLKVIQEALSPDYHRVRQAEETLNQWENEPQFLAVMQDIFYDQLIEHNIRFLSGIYLKNCLNRLWQKPRDNLIDCPEKKIFRERSLQFIQEPNRKLTMQNAVIVAKIACFDYPNHWPDLFSILIRSMNLSNLQNSDQGRLIHNRVLEILKELLSNRVPELDAVASNIFQTITQVYVTYVDQFIASIFDWNGTSHDDTMITNLNMVSMCIRCLRILMMEHIKDFHRYDGTKILIKVSMRHLEQFMHCRSALLVQHNYSEKFRNAIESVIEDYGSFYLGIQKSHPVSSVLCPTWLDVIKSYWQHILVQGSRITSGDRSTLFEQHLLQGMLLMNSTIKLLSHSCLPLTEEEVERAEEAVQLIRTQLLTQECVHPIAETLVTQYMQLSEDDLCRWADDPEGWANAADSENWEFELRPCAELTCLNLLNQFSDQLAPTLLDLVQRMENATGQQNMLLKDAVYTTIGLGVHSLSGKLDFESLVVDRFVADMVNKSDPYKILRRRIAWILGKWVVKDINVTCKRVIYEMFIQLMARNEDLVVRLTAAFGLKLAVDDLDFDVNLVLPYLTSTMASLLNLLVECEDPDSTMKLISTVNTIMDKAGPKMMPYAPQLIQLLIPLWSPTADPLLQSSLIISFTTLIKTLNGSFALLFFLGPVLDYSTSIKNDAHIYLLEDSLDLWWTVLQTAHMLTPPLTSLFSNALELLDYDTDHLKKLLKIVESYIMLDQHATLQPAHVSLLFTKLAPMILCCEAEVASDIADTLDLVIQSSPLQTCAEALLKSGLLTNILHVLLQNQMYNYAIMSLMNIFARLTIYDPNFVVQAIQIIGQQQQAPDGFFSIVLDTWIQKFSGLNQKKARKLSCIGFTNLLSKGDAIIVHKLPEIMSIWVRIGSEFTENNAKDFYADEEMEKRSSELINCAETSRREKVYQNDPVFTINLMHLIRQTVNDLTTSLILNQVDVALTEQIKQFLQ